MLVQDRANIYRGKLHGIGHYIAHPKHKRCVWTKNKLYLLACKKKNVDIYQGKLHHFGDYYKKNGLCVCGEGGKNIVVCVCVLHHI